mmetsp:Transcript_28610/g.91225  ORF Transcript_28610/g.91225 Transcript_28610/m.91225 type:complete len:223 (+) Transcript_28610:504-1172(+)
MSLSVPTDHRDLARPPGLPGLLGLVVLAVLVLPLPAEHLREQVPHRGSPLQLLRGALGDHPPAVQQKYSVHAVENPQLMRRHQHSRAARAEQPHGVPQQMAADVRVHRREGVVEQDDTPPAVVHGARERYPCLLPPGKVYALLANLGLVATRELVEVVSQAARLDRLSVPSLVEARSHENIVAHGRVNNPRALGGVRRPRGRVVDACAGERAHLPEHGGKKR